MVNFFQRKPAMDLETALQYFPLTNFKVPYTATKNSNLVMTETPVYAVPIEVFGRNHRIGLFMPEGLQYFSFQLYGAQST